MAALKGLVVGVAFLQNKWPPKKKKKRTHVNSHVFMELLLQLLTFLLLLRLRGVPQPALPTRYNLYHTGLVLSLRKNQVRRDDLKITATSVNYTCNILAKLEDWQEVSHTSFILSPVSSFLCPRIFIFFFCGFKAKKKLRLDCARARARVRARVRVPRLENH